MSSSNFPNRRDAITLLYLSKQNLAGKSPGEIAELYDQTFKEITDKLDELNHAEVDINTAQ